LGPLCQECDFSQGYSKASPTSCLSCNKTGLAVFLMTGVLLFSFLYVVISVDSTLKKMRYKEEKNIKISTRNKFYASITIKMLIHYA
jgi:hypothetical protein